jgi:transcriptional regulator with XRE-family HTH domain
MVSPHKVRRWRLRWRLTQRLLGEAIGADQPYVSNLEAGRRNGNMRPERLAALARTLNVTVEELLEEEP